MPINLEDIIQVVECENYHDVNVYLNIGWTLINTHGDNRTYYVLGWNKLNGDIKYPNPKDIYDPEEELRKHLNDNQTLNEFLNGDY